MKIKPAPKKGKVIVELESKDEAMLKPLPIQLQRILVPVDFSDTARKALQYALPFATAFGAELVLVHVMQPLHLAAGDWLSAAGVGGQRAGTCGLGTRTTG